MSREEIVEKYIVSAREEFTNKLVRTIKYSLELQDEHNFLNKKRLQEARDIMFFALLGHFVHSQGTAKCTYEFQSNLRLKCKVTRVRVSSQALTNRIENILRKFTLEY